MSIVTLESRHLHRYLSIGPVQSPSSISSPGLTMIPLIAEISAANRNSDVNLHVYNEMQLVPIGALQHIQLYSIIACMAQLWL